MIMDSKVMMIKLLRLSRRLVGCGDVSLIAFSIFPILFKLKLGFVSRVYS